MEAFSQDLRIDIAHLAEEIQTVETRQLPQPLDQQDQSLRLQKSIDHLTERTARLDDHIQALEHLRQDLQNLHHPVNPQQPTDEKPQKISAFAYRRFHNSYEQHPILGRGFLEGQFCIDACKQKYEKRKLLKS